MDPKTVIFVLALNLASVGGLLYMIGERMPDPAGMRGFATGSVVFGLAYLLRVVLGHSDSGPLSVLPDAAMLFATLSYATGLRQFEGLPPLGRRFVWVCVLMFSVASVLATAVWHGVGRHAVLNLALALAYLRLSNLAMITARRESRTLRQPLLVLAAVMLVLGSFTAMRGLAVPFVGEGPLFNGLAAQVYYGYSTIVTVVLGPTLLWMVFLRLNDHLATMAMHDPLTRLLNRNGLDEALRRHFGQRPTRPLVLIQIDIDHFKRINDSHGHAAGDAVLQTVAVTLLSQVRGGDFVARLGGEEFLVGFDGRELSQAMALAERLRVAVASQRRSASGLEIQPCTVSIGVSPLVTELSQWEPALRESDRALYQAKQSGRDRVVSFDAAPTS